MKKLNDLSREELETLRSAHSSRTTSVRNCEHCGKLQSMRADQKFCSTRCRKASFDERQQLYITSLLLRIETLEKELSELKGQ
jgi:predicted nucleic acid-binding Zn ribbon protein